MHEGIREQFFPMRLPSGVVCRALDRETAQESIKAIKPPIFPPKQAFGVFEAPEARREKLEHLKKMLAYSDEKWMVFYSEEGEPVGWFLGYMQDEDTFFIDTIGLVPAFRNRGIYSAFLRGLVAYLGAKGYERVTSTHHPNNRAVLIAELKAGFSIVGLELHEGLGPAVKTAYLIHDDRREGFERVFSMAPDPTSDVGWRAPPTHDCTRPG